MNIFKTNLIVTVALAGWAMACGGAALPSESLTSAKEAVSAAEAVGAKDEPQADLHLKMAQDGIIEAEKHIAENENKEAVPLLERAIADAELARELTDEAKKQRSADEALARLQTLQEGANAREN
jgi:hypothetical protein